MLPEDGNPKEIRREAGLKRECSSRCGSGTVASRSSRPAAVKLVRKGRLLISSSERSVAVLTSETVERTRRALRRERAERF